MKFEFIGKERRWLLGKWYFPGEIIEADSQPNKYFQKVKKTKGDKDVMES